MNRRQMRFSSLALLGLLAACGTPARPDVVPPDPPTQQAYEPVEGGTLSVTWRNPRDKDFAATMLVRIPTGGAKVDDVRPEPKASPKPGDAFGMSNVGAGVVLYVGAAGSFLDTQAPSGCVGFSYQLWSRDEAGNWSAGPAQLDVEGGAASEPPKSGPTALTAAEVDGDVQLAWTNPSSGASELRVVRKQGAAAPFTPADGVAIYRGVEASTAEPLAGLGFVTWSYAVFACNACGVCNPTPATVRFTRSVPADGGTDGGTMEFDGGMSGPLTPSNLSVQLSGDGKNVLLSWNNPAEVTSVKLLRTLNGIALGPGDSSATLVFQGAGTNATEKTDRLTPHTSGAPQLWHYRVYGCKNASCETVGAEATFTLSVSQALKAGGYTLFWRHATANVCLDQTQLGPANMTTQPNWWRSCDKNCNTAYARQIDGTNAPNETFTIHNAFAAKGFTVGRVLSSEFCRAVETAQGFDFGPPIELNQVLTYYVYDEAQRCPNTMAMLNVVPTAGTNTAMVSHAGFTCPIIDSLAWGEAAIYRPMPNQPAKFIARVPWNGWTTLP